MEQRRAQDVFG